MSSKKRVPVRKKTGLGDIELEVRAVKSRSAPPSEPDPTEEKLEQVRDWLDSITEMPDHSVIISPEKLLELRRILE